MTMDLEIRNPKRKLPLLSERIQPVLFARRYTIGEEVDSATYISMAAMIQEPTTFARCPDVGFLSSCRLITFAQFGVAHSGLFSDIARGEDFNTE